MSSKKELDPEQIVEDVGSLKLKLKGLLKDLSKQENAVADTESLEKVKKDLLSMIDLGDKIQQDNNSENYVVVVVDAAAFKERANQLQKDLKKIVDGARVDLKPVEEDIKNIGKSVSLLKKDFGFSFAVAESISTVRILGKEDDDEKMNKKLHKAVYTFGSDAGDCTVQITYGGPKNQTTMTCKGTIDAEKLEKVKADFKKSTPNASL